MSCEHQTTISFLMQKLVFLTISFLMQLFKIYRAIGIYVCFEVPCFFEVHIPVVEYFVSNFLFCAQNNVTTAT